MIDTGPFQAPTTRDWFDSLPNPDYWRTCEELKLAGRNVVVSYREPDAAKADVP